MLNAELPQSSRWQALTILCPPRASSLTITSASVWPRRADSAGERQSRRSAWLWSPALWQRDVQQLWRIVDQARLNEIYITVPVSPEGQLANDALRNLLQQAQARDIAVWPVIGDPRDVLDSSRAALRTRLESYARFNGSLESGQQLAGVQLDIEPYLLRGFRLDPAHWRERYIETVAFARGVLGPFLNIDLVVPVWWGSHPDFGQAFLDRLAPYRVSLSIMNYRTDVLQLLNGAEDFLAWGDRHQRPVRIGLEAGTLTDETIRRYLPDSGSGELWQIPFASMSLLLLFDSPAANLPGQAYRLADQRSFPARNLSFKGDLQAMYGIADYLRDSFLSRSAFRGISFHGLDEVYGELLND